MSEIVESLVAQSGDGASSLLSFLPMFIGLFAVMYFLMIRPERKKQQELQSMMQSLKRGDEVMLTSGLFGKIQSIEEKAVVLEIGAGGSDKLRVKVLKNAIMGPATRFLGGGDDKAEPKKLDDKSEKSDKADKSDKSDDKKEEKKSA